MAFKKNQSGNPKGRLKGTANKVTTDLRQWVNTFIDDNREQIKADWLLLDPKDRIQLFEKLLKYSLPTLQSIAVETDFDKLTDEQLDTIINELKKAEP